MEKLEAIKKRHSVRDYLDKEIESASVTALRNEIENLNIESGLSIKLVTNDPKAFDGIMAHFGKFRGVKNYIALIGKSSEDLDEKVGYCGEKLVILAQTLGLNTCWVALTYNKSRVKKLLGDDEKLFCVIALGYGKTQGVPHKSKPIEALCNMPNPMPEWFENGMEAAALAPTAMNQQKFKINLNDDGSVSIENLGGFYTKIDLGIVKYHFEAGAGKNFKWAEQAKN